MTSIRPGHSRAMYTVKFVGLKLNGSNFWKHSWRTRPVGPWVAIHGHTSLRAVAYRPPDCPSLIRYPASGPGRGLNAIRSVETAGVHHPARRGCGGMAAGGASAAVGDAGNRAA